MPPWLAPALLRPGEVSRCTIATERRKSNADERRRQLCDAAIELLGEGGARGLSHPKVDQRAGVPAGTTSFYYRTRHALVHALAERLTDLDMADLNRMTELRNSDASCAFSGTAGFASMVMMSAQDPWLTRTKARYELMLGAGRDPELARILDGFASRMNELARGIVAEWHAPHADLDPALIDEQANTTMTFVNGVMMSFVSGRPVVRDTQHLDDLIQAVLAGITRLPHRQTQ